MLCDSKRKILRATATTIKRREEEGGRNPRIHVQSF